MPIHLRFSMCALCSRLSCNVMCDVVIMAILTWTYAQSILMWLSGNECHDVAYSHVHYFHAWPILMRGCILVSYARLCLWTVLPSVAGSITALLRMVIYCRNQSALHGKGTTEGATVATLTVAITTDINGWYSCGCILASYALVEELRTTTPRTCMADIHVAAYLHLTL